MAKMKKQEEEARLRSKPRGVGDRSFKDEVKKIEEKHATDTKSVMKRTLNNIVARVALRQIHPGGAELSLQKAGLLSASAGDGDQKRRFFELEADLDYALQNGVRCVDISVLALYGSKKDRYYSFASGWNSSWPSWWWRSSAPWHHSFLAVLLHRTEAEENVVITTFSSA